MSRTQAPVHHFKFLLFLTLYKSAPEGARSKPPLAFDLLDLLTQSEQFLAQRLQILGSVRFPFLSQRYLILDSHPTQSQRLH